MSTAKDQVRCRHLSGWVITFAGLSYKTPITFGFWPVFFAMCMPEMVDVVRWIQMFDIHCSKN